MIKPWQSIDKQLNLLKTRGMTISDDNEAKYYLSTVGYTRLMGYAYPFRILKDSRPNNGVSYRKDNFMSGTSFETVIALYKFDNRLKELCFRAIKKIELKLRFGLVNTVGKQDPYFYLEPTSPCFQGTVKAHQSITRMIQKFYSNREKSRDDLILHYKNENLPIWIAVEIMDFGSLYYMYKNIENRYLRKIISDDFKLGLSDGNFLDMIHAFNLLRNRCAHHSQVFNKTIKSRFVSPFGGLQAHTSGGTYTALHSLACCQKVLFDDEWIDDVVARLQSFPSSPNLNLVDAIKTHSTWEDELKSL